MTKRLRTWLVISGSIVAASLVTIVASVTYSGSLWVIWVCSLSGFYMGANLMDFLDGVEKEENKPPVKQNRLTIENEVSLEYFLRLVKQAKPDEYELRYNFHDNYVTLVEDNVTFRTMNFLDEDCFFDFRSRIEAIETERDKQDEVRGP